MPAYDAGAVAGPSDQLALESATEGEESDFHVDDGSPAPLEQPPQALGRRVGNSAAGNAAKRSRSSTVDSEASLSSCALPFCRTCN